MTQTGVTGGGIPTLGLILWVIVPVPNNLAVQQCNLLPLKVVGQIISHTVDTHLYADAVLHQVVEQVRVKGQAHLAGDTSSLSTSSCANPRKCVNATPAHG